MEKRAHNFKDLTGSIFTRLTVIKINGKQGEHIMWECQCICGKIKYVLGIHLRSHKVKSCGCWKSDNTTKRNTRHNKRHTREYNIWNVMKQRCYNPKIKSYPNYGGRGVVMCDRWRGDNGFINFLEDMGKCPSLLHSLDRIDFNGIYEPSNCRWATSSEQTRNTRKNVWYEHNGNRMITTDWAIKFKVNRESLRGYIKRNGFEAAYKHYMSKLST